MKKILVFILMITMSLLAVDGMAQKKRSSKKQQKAQVEKKESDRAQKESQLKDHQKHHLDIQSKSVRKRMKRNERARRKARQGKKEPFYKRWFKRKNRWK